MSSAPPPIPGEAPPSPQLVRRIGAALAFVAGFVDTVGFIALFSLFTAHVTGNFVVIGASLVNNGSGLLTKLLALPVFVLSVAIAHLVMAARMRAGRPSHIVALVAQAVLLALFMALGLAAGPFQHGDAPLAMLTGLVGVAAMGIQNAASRVPFKDFTPTTVMTGNTTQLVMDLVDVVRSRDVPAATTGRLGKTWPVVLGFVLGAAGGALGIAHLGFACLAVPVLVLIALALWWRGHLAHPR